MDLYRLSKCRHQRQLLTIFIFLLFFSPVQILAQTQQEVLVRVNEASITRRDLQIEMGMLTAEMELRRRSLPLHLKAALSRKLVENLIQRELLYQRAQKKKIKIQRRWVDKALAEFKAKLGATSAYKDYLNRAAVDESQLKARIEKGLIVRRLLRREVIRPIKVSEAEMQAFYRQNPDFFQRQGQVRIRHIMISVDPPDDISKRGEALLRIQAIEKKLLTGANFAALALDASEDTSRTQGGDIGYLERSQLIAPMAEAVFSLDPGQVSAIIESRLGYHIVQLVDKIPSSQQAYRNARTKIERTLRRNKENTATQKYLVRLVNQADIQRLVRP